MFWNEALAKYIQYMQQYDEIDVALWLRTKGAERNKKEADEKEFHCNQQNNILFIRHIDF